ncbi:MAG: AbrB/MazE/SpoVT family DNA-binding domain-containing protein [Proteobacteria bacterium]|nr:AbrB/MazE/SpoVT family DNA-binding domain-containing protein [Pseudomonadota bacterium]
MTITAKITSKGQVTIPKRIREVLKGNVIEFEVVDEKVIIKPVMSIGGSLKKYAKEYKPINEIKETVWGYVVHDKPKG